MAPSRARYKFGPLERRGLIAGWRGGQIASVAAGLALAVAVLHGRPSLPSVVAAIAGVGACVAFAWWPIGGRTGEQWFPTVVRWSATGIGSGRRRRAGAVGSGHCMGAGGKPCLVRNAPGGESRTATRQARRQMQSGPYGGLHVLGYRATEGEGSIGVVYDAKARTYTAALAVLGHNFGLLGADEKERRVASWAGVLSSLARDRSVVHRLQWIATTVPDDGIAVDGYLQARGVLERTSDARRSYATLLSTQGAETCRHEALLVLQVRAGGASARTMRALGGGDQAGCALVRREIASLRRQLAGADIPVERVLDEKELATCVRHALDAGPGGATPRGAGRRCPPCGVGWPWPLVTEEEWGALRADGCWHATYWVAEWPRVEVGPEFLSPLLLGSTRRSVAMVMEPLSPAHAVRQAERARTADIADAELRRRGGFLSTARRAREAELATRREEELADGHASIRFAGYVTVTASTKERLELACDATEQAASQSRLELRRLYGDQERAFTCTLPLCRGLA